MPPTPQEYAAPDDVATNLDGERVVISGMSGLYPQSRHVQALSDILYNKENPVTNENCRWNYNHPEVSAHTGKVPDLDRFDAQFFKVHYRLGNSMDSMGRKILEQAYQAIYDAGVSPEYLSGKKVGVYTGSCFSETEKACFYVASSRTGFGIAGCSKTMFANRISYWLNAKGPSMSIDDACCSSFAALEQAYQAIARDECEAAIVGGANLCLHPQSSVHYGRIITLCKDGKTKSFDEKADGIAKSEAINVLFLQKAKYAKRVYAEVLHVRSEFTSILEGETGPRYGFYRDPMKMADFIKNFYKDAKVSPQAVEYVEAFGSAVPEADKAELEAIEEVYCKDRTNPLLVGSVISNIGYGEAASGISAITKVILGYHKGELAANLHCENPRSDIAALRDDRMRIVTEHQKFGRTYTAINGISVTGVNAHVLLHGHYKPKDLNRYKTSIPHLVTLSGRQDTSVKLIIDDLKKRPIDPEELALFHNIHQTRISGHLGRGYAILSTNEEQGTVSLAEQASYFDDAKRPLWFVYSGMGSQWAGMGKQLMRIPIFAAAIERCRKVLEPKGVDIIHIITAPDKKIFDNILNSFVGIAAIQIGLTDILMALGLKPDKIIGHSVGELGCAYADGCFTAEEMILSAYSRGLVSVQTPFIRGSMAAVGIGYQQIVKYLPPEIEVACHNGPESCTISGPADIMRAFVAQLTDKGVFAKEVPCSNIAYHSRYIAEAGPGLLKYLSEVIKDPKPRSERWVSSSVPEDKWNEPAAKYSSAQYHTNNLLNPVLFEETCVHIPDNAVLVEIAPHGLLQAILKRSLSSNCKNIPLTRRGHADNVFLVLDAIGKLYMEGYHPKVEALYPKVEFPVSTGTPMLSHLVEWAHNERWSLPLYVSAHRKMAASCMYVISVHDEEHNYLQGNVIRGKNLYPFAAALVAAWDTLAMSLQKTRKQVSVEYQDVHLFSQPILHDQRNLRLRVSLHRGTGWFEIMDENSKVASGYIKATLTTIKNTTELSSDDEDMILSSKDVYQLMFERDYFYRGDFCSILKSNQSLTRAQIVWNDNWVTFLDGILQLSTLRHIHDTVSQPSQIRRMCIDIKKHSIHKTSNDGKTAITAEYKELLDVTTCGGVEIDNMKFHKMPLLNNDKVALKSLKFLPRFGSNVDITSSLQIYLQTVAENINRESINVVGIVDKQTDLTVFNEIRAIFADIPGITVQYKHIEREKVLIKRDYFLTEADVVLVQNVSTDDDLCQILYRVLQRDTFLVNGEGSNDERIRPSALYRVVSSHKVNHTKLELIRWRPTPISASSTVVTVRVHSDLALLTGTRDSLPPRHKLVILSSYPPVSGLKDMVKQWRKDTDRNQVYLIMISDGDHLDELPELDLAINVLDNGVWGAEYLLPLQEKSTVENGVSLRIGQIGNLESLHWVEATDPAGPGVPVTVHYAAISDYDVKRASGVFSISDGSDDETTFAMDFSGITDSGERVMGVVRSGAASGRVKALPELMWPVPAHWSLEDAATVPSAYAHAFYCYAVKVNLLKSHSILIHGGTGALGQAAIAIGLAFGCTVFTTVSDVRKKRFLMKLFPELKEDHIGNSRDTSFGDMIRIKTNGIGCNIVFCCVKGELKNISLGSCSYCGVTLDVTQLANKDNFTFGMYHLTMERNYMPIDFTSVFTNDNVKQLKRIQTLISDGIARGFVRPLSRVTYSPHEVPRAFRLVAASRHRGRAVLRLRESVQNAQPRIFCSPDLCHVLLCDEDVFGLQFAERLVIRGARKLLIHCRNTQSQSHLRLKIKSWEKLGVKVEVSSKELSDAKGVLTLLSESNRLGPVEGLYAITTCSSTKVVDNLVKIVSHLDTASRKLCPSLRYFAVVTAGNAIGEQICLSRVRDSLPATIIKLLDLRKIGDVDTNGKVLSWRCAVDGIERALRSSQYAVLAYPQKLSQPSMLQQIADIAEINVSEETVPSITLLELGIELTKVPAIYSFLHDTHNVSLPEEQIPHMTVQQIQEMEEMLSGKEFKEVHGLATFFSYVDPDELLATTEIVFLPSLTNSATMRDDEFDVSQTYMCVVPGLEGHHDRFRELSERLKLPVVVLQPGLDYLQETIRETAERYTKILMKKDLAKDFYLLGYESGSLVALEMASILEEQGFKGTVFCIGDTPDEILSTIEEQLCELDTEEALQDAVLRHMFTLMVGNAEGLDQALENVSTWREKIETCVRMLLGRVAHSAQYARTLIEAAYMRIKQTRLYQPQPRRLRSQIVLLRPRPSSQATSNSGSMEMLQRYSEKPVVVEELRLPLAHATKDLRCPAIINKYLSQEILEAFEQKNICETYLLNADTFMMNAQHADV